MEVFLQFCKGYDQREIKDFVEKSASGLGLVSGLHGRIILLKPNLISTRGPSLSCSNPQFIAAVASWFQDYGARVLLGDSPAFGSASAVCRKRGISEALAGLDVEIVEFSDSVEKVLPCGVSVSVAVQALEADLFVGLPRVKAHSQMGVTMALKNIFGIVKGTHKAILHMKEGGRRGRFSTMLLELLTLLPENIHITDGIEIMSEQGPMNGRALFLNCIGGARSPVALDRALLEVLEIDIADSPLHSLALAQNLAGSRLEDVRFPLLSPYRFHGADFILPGELNPIRFNPFRFIVSSMRRFLAQ